MIHEALREFPVVKAVPVQWGDMDAFAHVNNTVYLRWFESARLAYFERLAVSTSNRGVAPILASVSCRFRAPVTYPDVVHAGARITDVAADRPQVLRELHELVEHDAGGPLPNYDQLRERIQSEWYRLT